MQSHRASLMEAAANVLAGLVLSFLLQLVLFGAMGIIASIGRNLLITAAFSILSLARSYILRRLFNRFLHADRRSSVHGSAKASP